MSDYTPPTLVIPTPGGNPGDGSLNGDLTIRANDTNPFSTSHNLITIGSGANKYAILSNDTASPYFYDQDGDNLGFHWNPAGTTFSGKGLRTNTGFGMYNGISTFGLGISPIYSGDNRTGLTTADSAAKTLYTTTAAGQLYRLMGRILATAGTSPSATYTIKWTEGGATITKTLSISALDSDSDLSILIQPDNGTAITAQLTAISGTGTTVNVAATVEQMA